MTIVSLLYWIWNAFCCSSGIAAFISLSLYLLPTFYLSYLARPQDLRKKYGTWAVVTGASSGIGKALTEHLAQQGVNVIMVALDNDMLLETHKELQAQYGAVELRAVGVDLGKTCETGSEPEYMDKIRKVADDVDVSVVFSNAGYLTMGFFERREADAHVSQLECNAISGIRIIHLFYTRMIEKNIKGCICITSSAACFLVRYRFSNICMNTDQN